MVQDNPSRHHSGKNQRFNPLPFFSSTSTYMAKLSMYFVLAVRMFPNPSWRSGKMFCRPSYGDYSIIRQIGLPTPVGDSSGISPASGVERQT